MNIIARQETQAAYPNIFARGVVAILTVSKRGRVYQIFERANGSKSKPLLVPLA